jgi:hypothetical protein
MRACLCFALSLAASMTLAAPPRYRAVDATLEPAVPAAGRFRLKGRFAAEESAGELREGTRFILIGRLAKGTQSCDFGALFRNGFEG